MSPPGRSSQHRRLAGYGKLATAGYQHKPRSQRRDLPTLRSYCLAPIGLPSNLKTCLQGTHRSVSPEHLQAYLDEFVFRHNRRRTPVAAFQTLLGLGALHEPTTYREIVTHEGQAAA